MISHLKELLKKTANYSLGAAITQFLTILLLPLYTRFLNPQEYGMLEVLLTVGLLSQAFYLLGINTSVQILFFSSNVNTDNDRNDLFITSVIIILASASTLTLLGLIIAPMISDMLIKSNQYVLLLRLVFLDTWAISLFFLFQANLISREKATLFSITTVCRVLLIAGFSILFVSVMKKGVKGIIGAMLIADMIMMLISALIVCRYHQFKMPTFVYANPLLSIGWPMVLIMIGNWVMSSSDRFFLAKLSTYHDVGIFGVSSKLAAGISFLISGFLICWRPFALRVQSSKQSRELYANVLIYYFIFVGWAGLLIILFSPLLLNIFATDAYANALLLIAPLIMGNVIYGSSQIVITGLEIVQRNYHIVWITIIAALTNITFNILFIPNLGSFGASIAKVISYAICVGLTCLIGQYLYPIPYNMKRLGQIIILLLVSYSILTYLMFFNDVMHRIILGSLCVAITGICLFAVIRREAILFIRTIKSNFEQNRMLLK